jgi:hypothetical protein
MNFKFYQIIIGLLGAVIFSTKADAAHYQGYVTNFFPIGGMAYFVVGNGVFAGSVSACALNNSMVFALDPSTGFGKVLIATVLSAKLSGKLVYAVGDGVCAEAGSPFPNSKYEKLLGIDLKG